MTTELPPECRNGVGPDWPTCQVAPPEPPVQPPIIVAPPPIHEIAQPIPVDDGAALVVLSMTVAIVAARWLKR